MTRTPFAALVAAALLAACETDDLAGQAEQASTTVAETAAALTERVLPSSDDPDVATPPPIANPPPIGLPSPVVRLSAGAFIEACLEAGTDPVGGLLPRLIEAGWTAIEFGGPTEFEVSSPASGLGGFVSTGPEGGFCSIGPMGSLNSAKLIADRAVREGFAEGARRGGLGGPPGPCDGWILSPAGGTAIISYDGLGNDPFCPDPEGAVIRITSTN